MTARRAATATSSSRKTRPAAEPEAWRRSSPCKAPRQASESAAVWPNGLAGTDARPANDALGAERPQHPIALRYGPKYFQSRSSGPGRDHAVAHHQLRCPVRCPVKVLRCTVVKYATIVAAALCISASPSFFAQAGSQAPQNVVRLHQGWDTAHELNYYYASQGTVIMPVSWLAALRSPDGQPFMAPEHMKRLGFVFDDRKSVANPNGWPIGFATDSGAKTGGIPTVGLTCAACHSSELTYRGTRLRIDGGQSHIDLDTFKKSIKDAIFATGADPARRAAFEHRAVALGYPRDRIDAQFSAFYLPVVRGRADRAAIAARGTSAGPGRNDAFAVAGQVIFNYGIGVTTNINRANAPVDYPYLWNIWNLYWVQYNGSIRQPMSRNIGESIGVGALTHFLDPATGKLASPPGRWRTSVDIRNLHAIETLLTQLAPPRWPESVLGPIDRARAARGRVLFGQNCAGCHGIRAIGDSGSHEWSVPVLSLEKIGTDPRQADNFRLTTYDGTKLGISKKADIADGILAVIPPIRTQAYVDERIPRAQWPVYDGFGRPSVVTSPCGYKARPLVGAWATPPFLHNGSVPSIFALLSESRPVRFRTGSMEFDPEHLGVGQAPGSNTVFFDSSVSGNSNKGHWFTNDRLRPGRIGRRFNDTEKFAIIEYLKSASYADYPRVVVRRPDPEPCVDSGTKTAAAAEPSHLAESLRR